MFDGKFVLYFFFNFVIPSLTSDTNWLDLARTITTVGRSSILLLFICLLQINILPVLDSKNSHSVTNALTLSLSIFLISLILRFFEIFESSEQTLSLLHWFSSMIFWKISLVEFFSSINVNLPPKLVKFFAKIKSFVSSLEIGDSIHLNLHFFYS